MKVVSLTLLVILSGFTLAAQVDLSTGASVYEIPIFSHADARSGLGTGVSLSYYSGGGIKLSEYAGMVGQNWNLNAGGQIVRIQHGEPDDQFQTEGIVVDNTQQIYETNSNQNYAFHNYYPNGFLYTSFPKTELPLEKALSPRFRQGTDASNKFLNSPRAQDDKEQDVFSFSVNGLSGTFAIGANGQVEVLQDSKIKIVPSYFTVAEMSGLSLRTRIKSFTITDENGVIYLFQDYELNNQVVLKEKYQDPASGTNPLSLSVYSSEKITPERFSISKWFVTTIKTPFSQRSIQFNYNALSLSYPGIKLPSYQSFSGAVVGQRESVSITESMVFAKTKSLASIVYPDGYQVVFLYHSRQDFSEGVNMPRLAGIVVKYGNITAHTASLTHQYFYKYNIFPSAQPLSDIKFMRLCLTAVSLDKMKYNFEYYTGTPGDEKDIVPPVNSFAQDYWGYYNASTYIDDNLTTYDKTAIANYLKNVALDVKDGQAKNGLLKKIIPPTGGSIEYTYEQNDRLDKDGNYKKTGGVRVASIIANDNVGNNPPVLTKYSYINTNGITSGWGGEENNFSFRTGIQYYRNDHSGFRWGGIGNDAIVSETISIILSGGYFKNVYRFLGPISTVKKLLMAAIEAISRIIVSFIDNQDEYSISTYSLAPYANGTTIDLSYSRVESQIVNPTNGIGKVVTTFSAPQNYAAEILPPSVASAYKQRMSEWKYNLPVKEIVFDNTGKVISETAYTYDNFAGINLGAFFTSYKFDVYNSYSGRFDWPVNNTNGIDPSWFLQDAYTLSKGHSSLLNTRQRLYGTTTSFAETVVTNDYTGSNNNLPREIYSFNSKGEKVGKTVYYSSDYTIATGAMGAMANNNMLRTPIATLNWYVPAGTSTRMYTGITVNEYVIAPGGNIRLYKMHTAYNKDPIPQSLVGSFNPSSIFIVYPNLRSVLVNSFDTNDDIVNAAGDGNHMASYVYDYNGTYKVATVANADPAQIAYTSFETGETGNWLIIDPVYVDNDFSPTGKRYLNFPNGNTILRKTGLNTLLSYTITYWSNSGSLTVNGTTAIPLVTINGWGLYKHVLTNVGAINITGSIVPNATGLVSGIDELRLYPSSTMMSTTVYDPVDGKIAECDANNRIAYYRYDESGRLIMVQDQNRNAVKTYEYNFKNQ